MILHIDMDAFFASIEQAINPRLKDKPLVVGSRGNKMHTVVCAASYEAKAMGIHSGMPSAEAFRLCPNLEFVTASQGKYIWTSEQIFNMLKGLGFELFYASIDEFQMDITDEGNPLGLAQDIQAKIRENFNITASIGIAKNCLLAKLASKLNKPNGIAVLTEDNLTDILSKTPVEKLCGVGAATGELLQHHGIKTCLELYLLQPDFLEQKLGKFGLNLYTGMHSNDSFGGVQEEDKPKSIGHSYTLPRASQTPGFIKAWIRLLSEMVAERLRQKNLLACTVQLWLNGPEIGNFSAQKTFQQATNDGYDIYHKSLKLMARTGLEMPKIRAIGITCGGLSQPDYPALFKEQKRREALLKAIDKINKRHGDGAICPAVISITKVMQQ